MEWLLVFFISLSFCLVISLLILSCDMVSQQARFFKKRAEFYEFIIEDEEKNNDTV